MAKQTRHGSSNNNKNYNNRKHHNDKIDLVNELHRPMRINFPRRQTVVKGLDDLWQSDLGILDKYAKYNRNYKYILVVIDCFSKYLWVEPLKSKTGTEVAKAFAKILTDRRPKNLQTDQGTEYFNSSFERLMKQHNINHYNTFSSKKAAMAERVIRTIKEKLYKHFSLNGEYKWLDVIPKIVSDYNNTVHRTIKMRPWDVKKENEERLYRDVYAGIKIWTGQGKFSVGDFVRISKAKHVFEKGYTPNWTAEVFKIFKVVHSNPRTYILKDLEGTIINGGFYEQELQKTKHPDLFLIEKVLRRRGNLLLVKWLGYKKEEWIDKNNVVE